MGIIIRNTFKSVEALRWRTESTAAPLFKKDGLYIVALQYMRTLLQMQIPKSVGTKEAKKKSYGSNNDCSTV